MTHLFNLIILSLVSTSSTIAFKIIGDYGVYCGLGNTNTHGVQPIDQLDNICQIHDICTAALGLPDCFCTEQLYNSLSQYQAITETQTEEKNLGLTVAYQGILPCHNYDHINTRKYLASNQAGYTYVPIYANNDTATMMYFESVYNTQIYTVDTNTFYHHFVDLAYNLTLSITNILNQDIRYSQVTVPSTVMLQAQQATVIIAVNIDNTNQSYVHYIKYPQAAVLDISGLTKQLSIVAPVTHSSDVYQILFYLLLIFDVFSAVSIVVWSNRKRLFEIGPSPQAINAENEQLV